jgi:acetoacetyl-CoA reductase
MSHQKVAIVTGGTRGIGASISTGLTQLGVHVAAGFSSNSEAAETLAGRLQADGASISLHQGNVGVPEDCSRVVAEVLEETGRVDYLINNAGINIDKDGQPDDH